ncbi:MAG: hypothetical protein IPO27_08775 [Bacteroidetes bacterium]|nr:hypothetical protein [Bacteroidota bacterium]
MRLFIITIISTMCTMGVYAQQMCGLEKKVLFKIKRSKFVGPGPFNFRIAVDSESRVAITSCNIKWIFLFNKNGQLIDSVKTPFSECVRLMEFDEFDRLQIADNNERIIYKINFERDLLDSAEYTNPEEWYNQLNHFYHLYNISSIPTAYCNPAFPQDNYKTRFSYSYNLYTNYTTGFLYQANHNFIRRLGTKRNYEPLRKRDVWFSDFINTRSKILWIDDFTKRAIFFDRSLKLYCEDYINDTYDIVDCSINAPEAAQFDFSTCYKKNLIIGVSGFDATSIEVSSWSVPYVEPPAKLPR